MVSPVNPFDSGVVLWLNHFAGKWGTADAFVKVASDNDLVQAVVPVTILWFLWFRRGGAAAVRRTREGVIATLLGSCVAVLLARALAWLLPFRTRPFATPGLDYHLVHSQWDKGLHGWSSFPSDHAVLFFALATGIALISRPLGIAMLIYAALVDALPRIYLGIHYPSDIIAGALLGILLARVAATERVRRPLAERVLKWMDASPGLAYAAMFLCSFEVATMFDSALQMAQMSALLVLSSIRHAHSLYPTATLAVIGAVSSLIVVLAAGGAILLRRRFVTTRRRTPDAPSGAETMNVPLTIDDRSGHETARWWRPELLEFTHDAIIIWEMDGAGILYWNAAAEKLYGYDRDEAFGQVTHTLLQTRLAAGGGGSELETTLARFGVWVGELIHTTRSGQQVAVEGRLALMPQQSGRCLVLEVNRDLTDRRSAEAARRSAESQLASLRQSLPA